MSTADIEVLPKTEDLSSSEQAALKRIVAEGELPQSDLWKALDLSSRAGSLIAQSLAEKGFIEREETTHEGRVTYLLTPIDHTPDTEASTTADASPPPSSLSTTRLRGTHGTAVDTDDGDGDGEASEHRNSTAAETDQHHDGKAPTTTRETKTDTEQNLSAREQRALRLIEREGTLPQSELWKALDITSRTGSRVATSLEDHGLIEREQTVYEGQRTYLLSLRRDPADLDFSLLIAGNRLSPLIGEDSIDPITTDAFTQWLLRLANEAQEQ